MIRSALRSQDSSQGFGNSGSVGMVIHLYEHQKNNLSPTKKKNNNGQKINMVLFRIQNSHSVSLCNNTDLKKMSRTLNI